MELVGRDETRAAVQALLDAAGCAVLLGPPGIGKSALAASFGPAAWVDLGDICTGDELQSALARTLACPTDRPGAVREALRSVPLLVLDGAEGVLGPLGERLEALAAETTVIVTSRRRSQLPAPVVEVGPLDDASGAALLRARVRSASQAAALEESELRELSRAHDGVPLALELVATHLRLYAPQQLLDRTLETLQDPRRPPRQQLVEVVRTTVDALSSSARALLAVASDLPAPVDAELLRDLADRAIDDDLLALLDAALLHPLPGKPPRFRVLAPVREVAITHLTADLRQTLLLRLGAAILPVAETADDLDLASADWADRIPLIAHVLGSNDAGMRLRASLAMARRERLTGPLTTTVARDAWVAGSGPRALRVQWGLLVAGAACHLSQTDHAKAVLDRIEPLLHDDERDAWRNRRAMWLSATGQLEEALALAVASERSGDDPWHAFRVGAIHFHMQQDLAAAAAAFRRARLGASAFRHAQATMSLGTTLREMRAPADTILAELSTIEAFPWVEPRVNLLRGVVMIDQGRWREAHPILEESERQLRAIGEDDEALHPWIVLQCLSFFLGEVPTALLLPIRPPPGERVGALVDGWRSVVYASLGQVPAALALSAAALPALHAWRASDIRVALAVALGPLRPDLALEILEPVPDNEPLRAIASALLAGNPFTPGPRYEEYLLAGLATVHARRTHVRTDGSGFVAPDGTRVDLGRRRVLKRVLATLAQSDGPLGVSALCEAVWPGENLVGDSGTRRVHVAISTLRGMGLRPAIATVSRDDGSTAWQLTASLSVEGL